MTKASFNTSIRADLVGEPLQLYCRVQRGPGDVHEVAIHLTVEDGWVDAKRLVEHLRAIARVVETELT